MTRKIALFVVLTCITAVSGKPEERRNYKPQEIETGNDDPLVPMSDLVSVKPPEFIAPAKVEITKEQRENYDKIIRETAARLGIAISGTLQVMDSIGNVPVCCYIRDDRTFLSLYFDQYTGDTISTYYKGPTLPVGGEKLDTVDSFVAYARSCYLKAFGSLPLGELEASQNGDGLKVFHHDSVIWKLKIDRCSMKKSSYVRVEMDGENQWSLSCNKGPTAEEEKALTENIRSHPTRVTDQQAVAAAWKNWKAVRPVKYTDDVDFINCELREGSPDEIRPWNGSGSLQSEPLEWANKNSKPGPFDSAFYEVVISKNLFSANVFIDRQSGQVLCIKQGVMKW